MQSTAVKLGYKVTELEVIPEDWEVSELSQLVAIKHGYGFQSQDFRSEGHYILTTPGHFHEKGGFRYLDNKQKYYVGKIPDGYILSSNDLIIAMTEQADGLLGSAAFIPKNNMYLHNQRLGKLINLDSQISIDFIYLVFNSPYYRQKVRETAAGTKVKHTSPQKLLSIEIPLPPLPEQKAIAAALSDVDALLTAQEALIAKKRDIKTATMQQLLTGKVRLGDFGQRAGATAGASEAGGPPGYQQTELGVIPEDWEVKQLGEISIVKTGPFGSALHESDYVQDGTPIITVEHLGERGVQYFNLPLVSDYDRKRLNVYTLKENDIVFSRVGSIDRNALLNLCGLCRNVVT